MENILKWIGGGALTGLGMFLVVFIAKMKTKKNTETKEIYQEIKNPDDYVKMTPNQKVVKWEEFQEILKKRRRK
jgi:hypothetical protein